MRKDYDFGGAKRGALIKQPGKTRITIRLDNDVLNWFKSLTKGGGSYQALINDALRAQMLESEGSLERTLRRVLREELHKAA